jgi:hypothetical protein
LACVKIGQSWPSTKMDRITAKKVPSHAGICRNLQKRHFHYDAASLGNNILTVSHHTQLFPNNFKICDALICLLVSRGLNQMIRKRVRKLSHKEKISRMDSPWGRIKHFSFKNLRCMYSTRQRS